jgi:hypothetical protein
MVQQRGTEPGQLATATKHLGTGLTAALAPAVFIYAGVRADRWLGTDPWLTLTGVLVGFVGGFYYMYYHLVIEPRGRSSKREGNGH